MYTKSPSIFLQVSKAHTAIKMHNDFHDPYFTFDPSFNALAIPSKSPPRIIQDHRLPCPIPAENPTTVDFAFNPHILSKLQA